MGRRRKGAQLRFFDCITSSIMNKGQQDHFRQNKILLMLIFIRGSEERGDFLCLDCWTLHLAALYALGIKSIGICIH